MTTKRPDLITISKVFDTRIRIILARENFLWVTNSRVVCQAMLMCIPTSNQCKIIGKCKVMHGFRKQLQEQWQKQKYITRNRYRDLQ